MRQRDPNIIRSGLSRRVTQDGVTVEVVICRLENKSEWSLEVVNAGGTSTVWDDLFPSDEAADEAFARTLAEEGMKAFLEGANVVPFRR